MNLFFKPSTPKPHSAIFARLTKWLRWLGFLLMGLMLGLILLAMASAFVLRFWGLELAPTLISSSLNKTLNQRGIEVHNVTLGEVTWRGISVKNLELDYYTQSIPSTPADTLNNNPQNNLQSNLQSNSPFDRHQISLNNLTVTFKPAASHWFTAIANAYATQPDFTPHLPQPDRVEIESIDHRLHRHVKVPAHIMAHSMAHPILPPAPHQAWSFKPEQTSLIYWFKNIVAPVVPEWLLAFLPEQIALQKIHFQTADQKHEQTNDQTIDQTHQARLIIERTAQQHITLHADFLLAQWLTPVRLEVNYKNDFGTDSTYKVADSIQNATQNATSATLRQEHYQIQVDTGNQLANVQFSTHQRALTEPTYSVHDIDVTLQIFDLTDHSLLTDLQRFAPILGSRPPIQDSHQGNHPAHTQTNVDASPRVLDQPLNQLSDVLSDLLSNGLSNGLSGALSHRSMGLHLYSPQWSGATFDTLSLGSGSGSTSSTPFRVQWLSQSPQDRICLHAQGQLNQQANGQIQSLSLTNGQLEVVQTQAKSRAFELKALTFNVDFSANITPQNLVFNSTLATLTVDSLSLPNTVHASQNKFTFNDLSAQLSLQDFAPKPHSTLNLQLKHAQLQQALNVMADKNNPTKNPVAIKQLTTQLNALSLSHAHASTDWTDFIHHLSLSTRYRLAANDLTHPQLLTQNWHANGVFKLTIKTVKTANINYSMIGTLNNAAGLTLQHQTSGSISHSAKPFSSDWQLSANDFLSGNPLAKTFSNWPGLLTIAQGTVAIAGQSRVDFASTSPILTKLRSTAQLDLKGLNGVYNQTAFTNASATLAITLQQGHLTLSSQNIHIQSALHAIAFGPIELRGDYKVDLTTLHTPLPGLVTLNHLKASMFNGYISLLPMAWQLNEPTVLALSLDKMDLNALLQAYSAKQSANQPTNQPGDFQGRGTLSGYLPVHLNLLNADQTVKPTISVQHGLISSNHAGQLQYRPSNAAQLATMHSSMATVLKVLSDFHYSELNSQVTLHPNGQLTLGFSIKGQNPAIEQGRPIHLNINIEEDLPSLITSLQIANQVSQTIQKRLEQKLLKQRITQ